MNKINLSTARTPALLLTLLLSALLGACSTASGPNEPGFELQLVGRSLQVVQGSSTDFVVRLNRDRFTDPITVTASDLPVGVTAGAVTTTGATATLRFLAASDAAQGDTKSITIFATADGKTSETVTTTLSVRGAPGALDTTFGGGRVTFPVSLSLEGAALAQDGGIVFVASPRGSETFTLAKLTADGEVDTTFRGGRFDFGSGRDFVGGVLVQPDGKILVGLTLEAAQPGVESSFGVARFTAQGEPDPSFSGDGVATLDGVRGVSVNALALAPSGDIVVVGDMFNGQDRDFLIARFNGEGQANLLRTDSFGATGDLASAATVAPDGSITVVGKTQLGGNNGFVLARYRSNGRKDTSFGQAGHVTAEFEDDMSVRGGQALALQPDGKIVAAGFIGDDTFTGMGLTRLLPNGRPDASFGNDGEVILDFEPLRISATSMVLEPGGRIVLAGTAFNRNSSDFALARLEPNGKLDLSFGDGGRQTTDFGGTDDQVLTLLRNADGRLLLVGGGRGEFKLARYWP